MFRMNYAVRVFIYFVSLCGASTLFCMDIKQSAQPKVKIQNFVQAESIDALMRHTKDTIEMVIECALASREAKSNDQIKQEVIQLFDNDSDLKKDFIQQYAPLYRKEFERPVKVQVDLLALDEKEKKEYELALEGQHKETADQYAQRAWQHLMAKIQTPSCCTIL